MRVRRSDCKSAAGPLQLFFRPRVGSSVRVRAWILEFQLRQCFPWGSRVSRWGGRTGPPAGRPSARAGAPPPAPCAGRPPAGDPPPPARCRRPAPPPAAPPVARSTPPGRRPRPRPGRPGGPLDPPGPPVRSRAGESPGGGDGEGLDAAEALAVGGVAGGPLRWAGQQQGLLHDEGLERGPGAASARRHGGPSGVGSSQDTPTSRKLPETIRAPSGARPHAQCMVRQVRSTLYDAPPNACGFANP